MRTVLSSLRYSAMTWGYKWRIPQRACFGWDHWIFTEMMPSVGARWPEKWKKVEPHKRWSIFGSVPVGFLGECPGAYVYIHLAVVSV